MCCEFQVPVRPRKSLHLLELVLPALLIVSVVTWGIVWDCKLSNRRDGTWAHVLWKDCKCFWPPEPSLQPLFVFIQLLIPRAETAVWATMPCPPLCSSWIGATFIVAVSVCLKLKSYNYQILFVWLWLEKWPKLGHCLCRCWDQGMALHSLFSSIDGCRGLGYFFLKPTS